MKDISITPATLEDIDALLGLWEKQCRFHHHLDDVYYIDVSQEQLEHDKNYLKEAITNTSPHILLAKAGEAIVGFIVVTNGTEDYGDTNITEFGEVKELFVIDEHRKSGIGKKLMLEAERHIQKEGLAYMKIQSSAFNHSARSFYGRLGYTNRQVFLFKKLSNRTI